jgi:hypothetical protein
VVEAVLIGGLVAAGGDKPQVVAAVLVYRALTWLLRAPVGVGCYLWWRRPVVGGADRPDAERRRGRGAAMTEVGTNRSTETGLDGRRLRGR